MTEGRDYIFYRGALEILKITRTEIFKRIVILVIGHSKINSFDAIGVNSIKLGYVNPTATCKIIQLYRCIRLSVN